MMIFKPMDFGIVKDIPKDIFEESNTATTVEEKNITAEEDVITEDAAKKSTSPNLNNNFFISDEDKNEILSNNLSKKLSNKRTGEVVEGIEFFGIKKAVKNFNS